MKSCLLSLFCWLFFSNCVMAKETELKFYRPFGEVINQIAPAAKVKLKGQCLTQSQLILREDAWHCQVDDKIFDPCFVHAGANAVHEKQVLCPVSPWIADSVLIELKQALNNKNHSSLDMSRTFPWAMELTNGERCQAVAEGALFDAMPVRYQCSGSNVLVGYLQRCKSTWSMLQKTPLGVTTIKIARAWF